MWSTLKRSSAAKLGHDKRDISAFDTVLFHSNLSSLRRKFLSDVLTDKIVLSCGPKVSEKPLKRRYWWLKNKERKFHFRFVERRFLAVINFTGSAEGALVPFLLRITHWPKSGLPVSPPGLFPPWLYLTMNQEKLRTTVCELFTKKGCAFRKIEFYDNCRNSRALIG